MSKKGSGPKRGRDRDNDIASRSPEWQRKEREADRSIARGDVIGPFKTVSAGIANLRRAAQRPRGR